MEGLNRAKRDLSDVIYRNIDQKYRKQLVELKTTELAVQDLDKYFKVGQNYSMDRKNRKRLNKSRLFFPLSVIMR